MKVAKETCQVCCRQITVRGDGLLRRHGRAKDRDIFMDCAGTGNISVEERARRNPELTFVDP